MKGLLSLLLLPLLGLMLLLTWYFNSVVGRYSRLKGFNFQGRYIYKAYGIAFVLVQIFFWVTLVVLHSIPPQLTIMTSLIVVIGGLGLIDDIFGAREAVGFKGHFNEFLGRRTMTTGLLKAIFGGGACLVGGIILAEYNWWQGVLNGLLLALAANGVNLLDLRPGRASKAFLLACFIATICLGYEAILPFLGIILAVLLYFPADCAGKRMMGDVGSNVLGLVLGFLIIELSMPVKISALLILALFNGFCEVKSLSEIIERNGVLRWVDRLCVKMR